MSTSGALGPSELVEATLGLRILSYKLQLIEGIVPTRRGGDFIATNGLHRSVPKYTAPERTLVRSIVANLSLKRIPDKDLTNEIFRQTNKTLSKSGLYRIRQAIKRDSYKWYKAMREGQYKYIHEFKERINEILDLQKQASRNYRLSKEPTTVKQTSLAELHRLNITLSNYFDVAPDIIGLAQLPYQRHQKLKQQHKQNRKRHSRLTSPS